MSRHALSFNYADVLGMLGTGMIFLWLQLTGLSMRELGAQAVLTMDGYLRRRPDPTVENALRTAFTELDKDLASILGGPVAPKGAGR
jgi:hypothetical protein